MNISPSSAPPFRIAALLHPDILASSITLPMEILTGAAQALGRASQQALSIRCFSRDGGLLTIQSGLTLATESLDALGEIDLLIIPAIWRQPRRVLRRHPEHIDTIARHLDAGGTDDQHRLRKLPAGRNGSHERARRHHSLAMVRRFRAPLPKGASRTPAINYQSDNVFCVSSVN